MTFWPRFCRINSGEAPGRLPEQGEVGLVNRAGRRAAGRAASGCWPGRLTTHPTPHRSLTCCFSAMLSSNASSAPAWSPSWARTRPSASRRLGQVGPVVRRPVEDDRRLVLVAGLGVQHAVVAEVQRVAEHLVGVGHEVVAGGCRPFPPRPADERAVRRRPGRPPESRGRPRRRSTRSRRGTRPRSPPVPRLWIFFNSATASARGVARVRRPHWAASYRSSQAAGARRDPESLRRTGTAAERRRRSTRCPPRCRPPAPAVRPGPPRSGCARRAGPRRPANRGPTSASHSAKKVRSACRRAPRAQSASSSTARPFSPTARSARAAASAIVS